MIYGHENTSEIIQLIKELNKLESKINKGRLELAARLFEKDMLGDKEKRKEDFLQHIVKYNITEDIASLRNELYRML